MTIIDGWFDWAIQEPGPPERSTAFGNDHTAMTDVICHSLEGVHHPDVLTTDEATAYLRLDAACGSPTAARSRLQKFVRDGQLQPLRWGKAYLYLRPALDQLVAAENGRPSVQETEGNAAE